MTGDDGDLYRIEDGGSKVWLSPKALEILQMHVAQGLFAPGKEGREQFAEYLRKGYSLAALTSPTAPMSDFSAYLAAPSGVPQYEAATGDAQQEQPPPDMALPDETLPTYRPLD